jgi:TetR/AcrR family transcriptional regulator, tetracycline repressor protein
VVTRTKERLSRAAVTRAAIALADAEGLEALTIRRLATELGVTPMALYWHFKDKDALHDGIVEAVLAEVRLPDEGGGSWDVELRTVLDALLDALAAHPAIADLVKGRFLVSEPGCELTERVLSLLRAGGCSAERASQLAVYALLFMVGLVTGMPGQAIGASEEEREQAVRSKWAALQALPPKRYPSILDSAATLTDCAASDQWLALGMDTLLAGIRGQAATSSSSPS